jgi:hypothetical protein
MASGCCFYLSSLTLWSILIIDTQAADQTFAEGHGFEPPCAPQLPVIDCEPRSIPIDFIRIYGDN